MSPDCDRTCETCAQERQACKEQDAYLAQLLPCGDEPVPDKLIAHCGAETNQKGQPFRSLAALNQHEWDCHKCRKKYRAELETEGIDPDIYDLVDEDLPDAAFWAMYHELGGEI